MHVNTVEYRIEKLTTILQNDLSDIAFRTNAWLALQTRKTLRKLTNKKSEERSSPNILFEIA